ADEAMDCVQMVLYANESVEGLYKDGARFQLSPCGAVFVYETPPGDRHPLQGCQRIQQRTAFTTSQYLTRVKELLDFRNTYTERPYITKNMYKPENIIKLYADVNQVIWQPASLQCHHDGSVKMATNEELAYITLQPNNQEFHVRYLARVSQSGHLRTRENQSSSRCSSLDSNCSKDSNASSNSSNNSEDSDTSNSRILRGDIKGVEIYLPDGSMLKSKGTKGQYFTHIIPVTHEGVCSVEERTYMAKKPPPSKRGESQSIAKILARGERLMEHLELSTTEKDLCCWKEHSRPLTQPLTSMLLEECFVDHIGKFKAFSNGHIRIVFNDRTCLDMLGDFTGRLEGCKGHSPEKLQQTMATSGQGLKQGHVVPGYLVPGVCRLLLPNGQYTQVCVDAPMEFQRYVKLAQKWCNWVNTPPSERYMFYKGIVSGTNSLPPLSDVLTATANQSQDALYATSRCQPESQSVHASGVTSAVDAELKKIHCFNYIVENTVLSKTKKDPLAAKQPKPTHNILQIKDVNIPRSPTLEQLGLKRTKPMLQQNSIGKLTGTNTGYWKPGRENTQRDKENHSSKMPDFVHNALKQTSQLMGDIDHILHNNGEFGPSRLQ
ncbi:unnamed protein product, partial [Owenia fusiformis]